MKSSDSDIFNDHKLGLRLLATTLAGIVVAGFLTWFMFILIQFGEQQMDESSRVQMLDFVRIKREEQSARKEQRAERPKTTEAPPAPSTPDLSDSDSDLAAIAVSDIPAQADMTMNMGMGSGISEGEFLPIVKVAPVYPPSAANRGIEGTCMVQYTVTTTGATKDIRVVEDKCTYSGFRRPSIAAAARFKYKPRIINGEPVEVQRVRNVFIFTLRENQD